MYAVCFSGVCLMVLGIIILVEVVKKRAVNRFWSSWFGVLFVLIGAAVMICNYGHYRLFWQDFTGRLAVAGLGLLCYSVFAMDIWKLSVCKQRITAEYISCRTNYSYRGVNTYSPVFSYQWEGEMYHCVVSSSSLSKRRIMKYHSGKQYQIYINPNNPAINQVLRRVTIIDLIMLVWGSICFLIL